MDLVLFSQDKEKWRGEGGSSEHGDEPEPFIKLDFFFFTI